MVITSHTHTFLHMWMGVCVCVQCQYIKSKDIFPTIIRSAIMDLKVAFVIVCLCALAITLTKGNYHDKFS